MDKSEDLFQPFKEAAFEADLAKLKLIDRIIELRRKTGLSQQDLGLRIGKDKSFFENLESKKNLQMDIETLIRMAHALNAVVELNFNHS